MSALEKNRARRRQQAPRPVSLGRPAYSFLKPPVLVFLR
jgi:hypothetical protein